MLWRSYKTIISEELRFVLGIPGEDALRKLGVDNIEQVHSKWSAAVLDFADEVSLFAELDSVIHHLSAATLKLDIVTSKTRQEVMDEFDPFGLSKHFQCIISASDTEKHKPHPKPLLKRLQLLQIQPNEVVYIGDSIYDLQCAKQAGVCFALALWGAKSAEGFEEAEHILRQPEDVNVTPPDTYAAASSRIPM
ncbi:HAD family hydrolase [Paenibacillus paeoniae]|uniref:HAD family hydrolase n=1 Tax=Paenibacillus paeoniae TaxID=2292705 RepID=A0A371PEM3_9BACL|nr:HAD family hydrolase [Paenibacillus paeoniae]REK74374.1 HAD family hydrolase [Paenibacillus paeoniae]